MPETPSIARKMLPWLIALLLLSLWLAPASLVLKNFGVTEVGQLLTSLLLVALFVERALEVFLTTWRGPDSAENDRLVEEQKTRVEALKAQESVNQEQLDEGLAVLREREQARTRYKSETQRRALWAGLSLGLLVSATGVRALQMLVDAEGLAKAAPSQRVIFHLVDIVLTGGVLAGGSEGIHKLTQVYTNFMERSARQAKGI